RQRRLDALRGRNGVDAEVDFAEAAATVRSPMSLPMVEADGEGDAEVEVGGLEPFDPHTSESITSLDLGWDLPESFDMAAELDLEDYPSIDRVEEAPEPPDEPDTAPIVVDTDELRRVGEIKKLLGLLDFDMLKTQERLIFKRAVPLV